MAKRHRNGSNVRGFLGVALRHSEAAANKAAAKAVSAAEIASNAAIAAVRAVEVIKDEEPF